MPEMLSDFPVPPLMPTTTMSASSNQSSSKTELQSNGLIRDASRLSRRKSKYERALLGRYRLGRTIGTGNFAKVKLATHLLTDREVAIKIIEKAELSSSSRRKLSREVNLMKVLDHPNIIKLLEIIDTEKIMYLVMEYASGGELYEYISKHGRMTEKVAREKFRQILSAVEYCHQKHIIHRDLKMENLLLDTDMNIKLADFGFANEFEDGKKLNTFCGSPPYAAPELFRGKEYTGPEVDVWSLGVILFKLVSGTLPFDGHSLSELRERVLRGRYRIPFYMSTECEKLLKKMLVLNPSKRHTLQSIMNDPWVNLNYDDNPLTPYVETKSETTDPNRIEQLMSMGFGLNAIVSSLKNNNFDEITATYNLLERRCSVDEQRSENGHEPPHKLHNGSRTPTPPKPTISKLDATFVSNPSQSPPPSPGNSSPTLDLIEKQTPSSVASLEAPGSPPSPKLIQPLAAPRLPSEEEPSAHPFERKISIKREYAENKKSVEKTADAAVKTNAPRPVTTYELHLSPLGGPTRERPVEPSPKHWYPSGGHLLRNGTIQSTAPNGAVRNGSIQNDLIIEHAYSSKLGTENPRPKFGQTPPVAENKPVECVYKSAVPNAMPRDQQNTKMFPSSAVQHRLPEYLPNVTSFGRFAPMRQTIHAYRPEIEIRPESPGVAESKDSPAVQPRINLSKIDAEESSALEEVHDSPKSKGLLRSLTSRFTKRHSPYRIDIETEEDSEMPPKQDAPDQRRSEMAYVTEHEWPNSTSQRVAYVGGRQTECDINYTESSQPTQHELPSDIPTYTVSDHSSAIRDSREPHDRTPAGFFRSVAQRFSRRKYHTNGSAGSTPSDYPGSRTSNVSLKSKDSALNSTAMPQSILDSVRQAPPKFRSNADTPSPHVRRSVSWHKPKQETDPVDVPPAGSQTNDQIKPRVFRFTWSMKATSKRPADEILQEVKRVLDKFGYSYDQQHRYLLLCEDKSHSCATRPVSWELEICGVPRLNVNGIRFKKISGTSVACKSIVTNIFNNLII
ncbi:MAP microtubule affinity-regulating kinase 1, variant 2 [Clonorchis sinensis]|uniref:non-specific serine/threonine protein kinase n=3 Tax=Clonorchis sinensis TaxID=79923 RepID=A0A3R7CHY1_CLOSI|nr:MAP microtubule affinity-regulating kinase 1, variant 2 [Clonorchis sinensis]